MANAEQRRKAGNLNNMYFSTKRGTPTQVHLNKLKKEFEKFKERAERQKRKEPENLMKLIKFSEKDLARIQNRINSKTAVKDKPGMVRKFPKVKGSRVFVKQRA